MNLQALANLGILGGALVFLLGVFFMVAAIHSFLTFGNSSSGVGAFLSLLFGVTFMVTGLAGLGSSYLATKLPLVGGLGQVVVGAFGMYLFLEIMGFSPIPVVLLVGSGLLIISGVLNIVISFTAQ